MDQVPGLDFTSLQWCSPRHVVILGPVSAFESQVNCGVTSCMEEKEEKRNVPMEAPGHSWVFGAVTLFQGIEGSPG